MTTQELWPVALLVDIDRWADPACRADALAQAETAARQQAAERHGWQLGDNPTMVSCPCVATTCDQGHLHTIPTDGPDATHISVGIVYRIMGGCN